MAQKTVINIAESVKARLLQIAKRDRVDFNLVLNNYALERFLYRLSRSQWKDRFLLKGALLFRLWYKTPFRPTSDIDLEGKTKNDLNEIIEIFKGICSTKVTADGIMFLPETVKGEENREEGDYNGIKIVFRARIDRTDIPIQVDIGFGDAVEPSSQKVEYPVLLDFPIPQLLVYPLYSMISEKFQIMVKRGIANSRMKDYYDLWTISQHSDIDGKLLSQAIEATFKKRNTDIPTDIPLALDDQFSGDHFKQMQWSAFVKRIDAPETTPALKDIVAVLRMLLIPPVIALTNGKPFLKTWRAGKDWVEKHNRN
jgi:predicted nucleotidyltransferase component of viral defense system